MADTPEGHAAIQRDVDGLEKWLNRNLVKFNNRKCRVQHLERNNPMHHYTCRAKWLESSFSKKDVEVLVDAS